MRASAFLLMTLAALGGCALPIDAPNWASDDSAGPEPVNYRFVVANDLHKIAGQDLEARLFEISPPRRVNMQRGATWMACVKELRFPSRTARTYHSVFIQRDRIVESRFAVVLDQCETETYTPFDWKADRDNPLPLR